MSEQVTPSVTATAAPVVQPTATTQPQALATTATPAPAPAAGAAPASGATAPDPKKDESKPAVENKTEKTVAPDKYDLKLPDGSKLGKADVAKVETLAREKGWSNDRAQEALNDRHATRSDVEREQSQTLKDLNDKTWKEELMADPEVGGQKFEQSGHLAYKAVEKFGGKEFADELKAMNLNHQPKLFKMLVNVGKAMESDNFVNNHPSASGAKLPPEQRMYPEMFKKE